MLLIIDDDSGVRSSLSFMLKRAGYQVIAVTGPREAMEVVRSEAPSLILMDMNFTLSTSGEEGLTLLKTSKGFSSRCPGHSDDCLGQYTVGCTRDAGRCIRLYHETLE